MPPPPQLEDRPRQPQPTKLNLSIALSLEVAKIRDEFDSVAILTVSSGQICEKILEKAIPLVLNSSLVRLITPLNDNAYLLPLNSFEDVEKVCKLGIFDLSSKQGLCTLSLSPWSSELGAWGKASVVGQWMLI